MFVTLGYGKFDGLTTNPTRGGVDNSQQVNAVVRVTKKEKISWNIFHHGNQERAAPANDTIRNTQPAQVLFQQPGLSIHPEHDREPAPIQTAKLLPFLNFGDHVIGFFVIVRYLQHRHFFAFAILAPERFRTATRIMPDNAVSCAENRARTSILLLQLNNFRIGKMMLEFKNIGYLGAAPTVDTLVVITDYTDVLMVFP